MRKAIYILTLLIMCSSARGQAIFVPRSVEQLIIKGYTGGTTTAGIALSASTTPMQLQTADWSDASKACVGFSSGVVGQIITSGEVVFALGGLTANTEYYLGSNGTITTTPGTTTPGYITQKVIRGTGSNTGIIICDSDLGTSTSGGASALNDLTDVTLTTPASGQFLYYDGSKWINGTSGASVAWGGISGTLSDQTDLNTSLSGKASTATNINTTSPLTGGGNLSTDRTLAINKASGVQAGYLDSADFTTFNNKQAALGFTPENSANKASADGYASLDSNSKVVQNPASGTTTSGANKIPISGVGGTLEDSWLSSNITKLGSIIELGTDTTGTTDNVTEGSSNLYYTSGRFNSSFSGALINGLSDVVITSVVSGHVLKYDGTNWINGTITGGGATWGSISGTLSDQSDLNTALGGKASTAITISTTSPLSGGGDLSSNRTLSIDKASGVQSGYLDSADFTTFNNKQAALGYTPEDSANKASANGYPSLDANSKVVQNPASGTTTSGASKIPISDGSGKIDNGWLNSSVSLLGQTIALGTETTGSTDNVSEGSINLYYTNTRADARIALANIGDLNDVVITSPSSSQVLKYNGTNWVNDTDATGGSGTDTPTFLHVNVGTTTAGNGIRLSSNRQTVTAGADNYTVALLHANGSDASTTLTDSSSVAHTFTASGNAQLDTAQYKFGSASLLLDGTGDYASSADSTDWALGGTFTIDLWIRLNAAFSSYPWIAGQFQDGNNYWAFYYNTSTNKLGFQQMESSSLTVDVSSSWSPSTSTWYHIEVVNNAGSWYFFVDGTQVGSTGSDATPIANNSGSLYIGAGTGGTGNYVNGWMDEIRISKGVARNTSNFTVQSSEYTSTSTADVLCVTDVSGDGSASGILLVGTTTATGPAFEVVAGGATLADSWNTRCDVSLKEVVDDSSTIVDDVYTSAKKTHAKKWKWKGRDEVNVGPMIDDPNIPEEIIWRGTDGQPGGFNGTGFMSYLYTLSLGIIKETEADNANLRNQIDTIQLEINSLKAKVNSLMKGGK